jgi:NAD-dependent dihydropyrimidine dehydrogenase PreA subunit
VERVERIIIDEEKCIGCRLCVKSCPVDVLRFDETKKKAVGAYPQECEWCLICEEHCPKDCLRVQPKIPTPVFEFIR